MSGVIPLARWNAFLITASCARALGFVIPPDADLPLLQKPCQ